MRPFYCALAGAGAMLLAGLSPVQAATEIEFWHAMSGALGERVDELVEQVQQVAEANTSSRPIAKGSYDEVVNSMIAAYRAKQPARDRAGQRARLPDHAELRTRSCRPAELMAEQGHKIDCVEFHRAGRNLLHRTTAR